MGLRIIMSLYTNRLYYLNAEHLRHKARIIDIHSEENIVVLNETIFHPQGGGQPSDQGTINGIKLVKAINASDSLTVLHLLESVKNLNIGDEVNLIVDTDTRVINTRLHSAGHLIHNIGEAEFTNMKVVKGHHFPKEACVEFIFEHAPDITQFISKMDECLKASVETGALVISSFNEITRIRTIKFADYAASPCGGTHVSTLDKIGDIIIKGAKIVKDKSRSETRLRLSYDV